MERMHVAGLSMLMGAVTAVSLMVVIAPRSTRPVSPPVREAESRDAEVLRVRRWVRQAEAELMHGAPPRHFAARPRPPVVPLPAEEDVPEITDELLQPGLVAGRIPSTDLAGGPCDVRFRLVDDDTGEPLETYVRVWRRFVPSDDRYTAGDEVRYDGRAPDGTIRLTNLPEGAYRLECAYQRKNATDPVSVWVDRESRDVVLRLSMPRVFPVHAHVFDARGDAVRDLGVRRGPGGSSSYRRSVPDWAEPRRALGGRQRGSMRMGRGCGPGEREPTQMQAGENGFRLTERKEPDRDSRFSDSWFLSRDRHAEIRCQLNSEGFDGPTTFAAPLVPLELIARTVLLPGEVSLAEAGRGFTATCRAVLVTTDTADRVWRDAEVIVKIAPGPDEAGWSVSWRLGALPGDPPITRPIESE